MKNQRNHFLFLNMIVYEISFHHVRNISAFSEFFNKYNTYWLSDNWEKLIENLLTFLIMKNFETADISDSALLLSNDVSKADKKFEKFINNNNLTY